MIICPMLLRTSEDCSRGPDGLTCRTGTDTALKLVPPPCAAAPTTSQRKYHRPSAPPPIQASRLNFPLNPTHPWKTTIKKNPVIIRPPEWDSGRMIPYIARRWSSYLRESEVEEVVVDEKRVINSECRPIPLVPTASAIKV